MIRNFDDLGAVLLTVSGQDLMLWLDKKDDYFRANRGEPRTHILQAMALRGNDSRNALAAALCGTLHLEAFSVLSGDRQRDLLVLAAGVGKGELLGQPLLKIQESRVLENRTDRAGDSLEYLLLQALIRNQDKVRPLHYHYHWMHLLAGDKSFLGGNRVDGCLGVFYEKPQRRDYVYLALIKIADWFRRESPGDLCRIMDTLHAELDALYPSRFAPHVIQNSSSLEVYFPDSILAGLSNYAQNDLWEDFDIDPIGHRVLKVLPKNDAAVELLRIARNYVAVSWGPGPAPSGEDVVIAHWYQELACAVGEARAKKLLKQKEEVLLDQKELSEEEIGNYAKALLKAGEGLAPDVFARGLGKLWADIAKIRNFADVYATV